MENPVKAPARNRRGSNRKVPRGTVRVECRRGSLGLGANIAGGLLDLSESGVRIILNDAPKLKDEVEVVFQAFGVAYPIKRAAKVVWVVPLEDGRYAAGVEFEKRLPYEDVAKLSRP